MNRSHYVVRVSSAKMPSRCWGRYEHVAVLEVDPGVQAVSMISERAIGVRSIVIVWRKQHVGSTSRSAASRAYAQALEMAGAAAMAAAMAAALAA